MIHLIWSILNGIIMIYFLYLIVGFIIKGKKIFRPQFKYVSIFIMIIGIVQIISATSSEKDSNLILIKEDYDEANNSKLLKVVLEKNLTFDINMLIKYSIDQNEYIPIESNSYITGLVSGYSWEFKSINSTNLNDNGEAEFIANGILNWNLFGIKIYNESKTFKGIIK